MHAASASQDAGKPLAQAQVCLVKVTCWAALTECHCLSFPPNTEIPHFDTGTDFVFKHFHLDIRERTTENNFSPAFFQEAFERAFIHSPICPTLFPSRSRVFYIPLSARHWEMGWESLPLKSGGAGGQVFFVIIIHLLTEALF